MKNNLLLRKIISNITMLFMVINLNSFTFADDSPAKIKKRSDIRNSWERGSYLEVVRPAVKYIENDRRAEVAYWLATSLCRVKDEYKPKGIYFLNEIKKVARKQEIIDTLDLEISNCNQQSPPRFFPSQGYVGSLGTYKVMELPGDPLIKIPLGTALFDSDDSIDEKILARRLINKNDKSKAVSSVKNSLTHTDKHDSETSEKDDSRENLSRRAEFRDLYEKGEVKSLQVGESFVFTCISCTHSVSDLNNIGLGLENYIKFFTREFGMEKPDVFIKIYAATNSSNFELLAQQLHGANPSAYTIGYSVADDMSMVIVLPHSNTSLYGTSKHELFHLMIRDNFGDAPPWIEEGMAALYEGSEIRGDKIVGTRNWREQSLRSGAKKRPTIEQLINMDWMQFNSFSDVDENGNFVAEEYSKIATVHATARYFILYLQEKGKLTEIYKKMREMRIDESYNLLKPEAKDVLEKSMGMPIEKINQDFGNWFSKLPDITSSSGKKIKSNKTKKLKPRRKKSAN